MMTLLYILATIGVIYMCTAWAIGVVIFKAGLDAGDFERGQVSYYMEVLMMVFAPIVLPFEIFSEM